MQAERQEKMSKGCPFCCQEAHVYQIVGDFRDRWGVGCDTVGCPATFSAEVAYYVQKDSAVNRWEERACPQEK